MASATATANPEREPPREPKEPRLRWWLPGSKLGRLIIALNVLGLAVLVAGALVLNELRRGLVNARIGGCTPRGTVRTMWHTPPMSATSISVTMYPVSLRSVSGV